MEKEKLGHNVKILKSHPKLFNDILDKKKLWEYRRNDSDFKIGNILILREYYKGNDSYSNRNICVNVSNIYQGPAYDIPDGYCIMSIEVLG